MCDCIKKLEDRVRDNFAETISDSKVKSVESVTVLNSALILDGGNQVFLNVEVEYTSENKKGEPKQKKENLRILPQYCPICGGKYEAKVG